MWKSSSLLPDRQSLARYLCWNKADFIIPGHGPGFLKNKKESPSQKPIFGKIFFDSKDRQLSQKTDKKLNQVEEILTFYVDGIKNRLFSINLIKSNNLNILINTGGKEQRNDLIKALNLRNLSPFLINFIIINYPGEYFCSNLGDFPTSTIFMCTDIAIPGPFYATFDHYFTFLDDDRQISVWRDLRTDSNDQCLLSVLVAGEEEGHFTFIGIQIDEFLLARFSLNKKNIKLKKIFDEFPQ